jgi:hypothetical protein
MLQDEFWVSQPMNVPDKTGFNISPFFLSPKRTKRPFHLQLSLWEMDASVR